MTSIRITTTQNVELEYEIASLGDRILGYLIDMFVLGGIVFLLMFVLRDLIIETLPYDENLNTFYSISMLLFTLLIISYDLICELLMNGQSVGKRIMKTRVVSLDGSKPTFGAFFLRWLLRIVDFSLCSGLVGLVAFLTNRKGQRIGDMAAGTTVIKLKERVTVHEVIAPAFPLNYLPVYPEVRNLSDRDITLTKDILYNSQKQKNSEAITALAVKIKGMLTVTSSLPDEEFVETIIKDYYYYVSE